MKKLFTLLTLLLCVVGGVKAETETIFSANPKAAWSVPASTTDSEITSSYATITGGKMYLTNQQTKAIDMIKSQGELAFQHANNNTFFKVVLDNALQAGDVISARMQSRTDTELGLWFSTATSRPGTAPTSKIVLATAASQAWVTAPTYTVTAGDGICGETTFYIYRHTGKSTYFNTLTISREVASKEVISSTITGININGASWDISGLINNTATIGDAYAGPPTVDFVYVENYSDNTSSSNKTESIVAVKNGANYQATSTALTNNITLTFTNVSNVLFSMTDPTAPTEALASKTSSAVTATFSPGGSATVYNGHKSNTAQMVYNDAINLNGSGDSYFKASFPAALTEGDVIDCSNHSGSFYVWYSDNKTNSTTLPYTIPAKSDLIGKKTIYLKKNGAYDFTWLTITRPKVITSQTFAGVKEGETTLTETTDYTVSETTITLTEAHKALIAPTNIKLINHISYDDATTEDQDVDVTLAKNEDYFEGTATIGATTYTVKVPVDTSVPVLSLSASSGSISLNSYTPTGSVKVTLTGSNLTDGTYDAPTAEGVTISPATYTVTDGTASQEFTITSTENTAASTNIVFTYEGAESQTYTLSYTKTAKRSLLQTNVTEATTWDWKKAGTNTVELSASTSPTNAEEFVMAELPEVNNDENFNSQALKIQTQYPTRGTSYYFQGYSIKFNTTVPGTINVTFSNTGGSRPYRYLRVNGALTSYKSGDGTMVEATGIFVPAGEVAIDFYIPDASDPQERFGDVVGTTMCRVNKIVFTPVTETTVTINNGTGYRTFASKYPTDWTEVTGVEAYTASVADKKVSFTKVTGEVPAGEGLLLKGADDTYTIPVCADIPAAIENAFVGVTSATTIENPDIFVLMNGTKGVGFYRTTADSFTVGANTAYLPASVAEGRSFIGFDDETTGISATLNDRSAEGRLQGKKGEMINDKFIYNLNGQRVEKPAKGLYIVNGKKYVK